MVVGDSRWWFERLVVTVVLAGLVVLAVAGDNGVACPYESTVQIKNHQPLTFSGTNIAAVLHGHHRCMLVVWLFPRLFKGVVGLTSSAVAGARQALISGIPSLSFSLDWKKGESEESHFKDAVSVCMPKTRLTSSAVAGARQALISGIPSLSFSLDWKKGESEESHFKDAVSVCMPVIKAAIRDVEKGVFPKSSSLHITVPASPAENKGFKLTKQSLWRSKPIWQAIAANRMPPAARFANQHGMGLQLAQLGRDASAAGAARRLGSQKKSLEVVESVGVSGKVEKKTVRYFRLEFQDSNEEDTDENLDFRALQDGFVSVTPISVSTLTEPDIENAASEWISGAL
ncbi:survival protein SurE-like phosphatase/nucleotidase [Artemisia annua]|uniref:Survival protein SurE-like phosphatase/nucleotidase n=1 Tax=Artemisia annua TaxID=35608 RepID=A0A2U1NBG2_ARTAN|nr:survival protein SurE-like phosphatase/nucleotidase [Artemisia annua]